jgi:hypothetical protein
MSSDVQHLTIQRAKKKEGFYLCPVGYKGNRTPFTITFEKAKILCIRETSSTVIIKCKVMSKYMDELNDKIVDTVRDNSGVWFNSTIDDELIEEYYISTLQYDKKQGETIRLKVKNIEVFDHDIIDTIGTLTVCLKYLKFYKQKFFPEFDIESFKSSVINSDSLPLFGSDSDDDDNGVDFDYDADEEIPKPSFEELEAMKIELLNKLHSKDACLQSELMKINQMSEKCQDAIRNLQNCNEPNNIIKMCEDYQNLICE